MRLSPRIGLIFWLNHGADLVTLYRRAVHQFDKFVQESSIWPNGTGEIWGADSTVIYSTDQILVGARSLTMERAKALQRRDHRRNPIVCQLAQEGELRSPHRSLSQLFSRVIANPGFIGPTHTTIEFCWHIRLKEKGKCKRPRLGGSGGKGVHNF